MSVTWTCVNCVVYASVLVREVGVNDDVGARNNRASTPISTVFDNRECDAHSNADILARKLFERKATYVFRYVLSG